MSTPVAPPPPPAPVAGGGRPNHPTPQSTSPLAIVSLVSGILGWTFLPMIAAIVAIITGHLARSEIRDHPGMEGDGLALVGLILGYTMIAISVLTVIVVILMFGSMAVFMAAAAVAG